LRSPGIGLLPVSGASADVGFAPKPRSGVFADARCAARSPARDLVKGRENSGAEKGVKGLPQFVHRLWRGPFPGKARARPYHRTAGWELRKGPVRVAGDRRMPAVLKSLQGRPVSPMEGTSGAADPAPLRGGVGDAALGSDASCRRAHAQAWYALGLARQGMRAPGPQVSALRGGGACVVGS